MRTTRTLTASPTISSRYSRPVLISIVKMIPSIIPEFYCPPRWKSRATC